MSQGGWFAKAPVSMNMKQPADPDVLHPDVLHPNVPVLNVPSLFSAKARTTLGTGKAPDAAAVKLTTEVNGVLAIPVLLMKCVFLWPDSQNAVTRFIANRVYPFCIILLIMGGMAFIVEGKYDSGVTALTAFGDAMASSMCLLKLLLLSREGPQLAQIRRRLQTDFAAMESLAEPEASVANARCTQRCRVISRRFAFFYVPLCASAVGLVVINAFDPPDKRRLTTNMPSILLVNPFTYWLLCVSTCVVCTTFYFYSVAYDTLFLSLCKHMSCKCEILKLMLRRAGQHAVARHSAPDQNNEAVTNPTLYSFEYWKDDGSAMEPGSANGLRDEVQENLKACVIYHNVIIQLRDQTEDIFAGVSLFQMAYILLGLGIPGLRLLRESLKPGDVVFLMFYAAWNFSQLLFYCWFADALAASSGSVSAAALAAMRPAEVGDSLKERAAGGEGLRRGDSPASPTLVNLSKAAGITLRLIIMRAQNPLYLTAGNFANITLELYLTIIRKSQSIYSYLIRMR